MNKIMDFQPGIVDYALYLPQKTISAEDFAKEVNVPLEVIRDKMGIHRKFVGAEEDQPGEMAVKASLKVLEKTQIDPKEIDVILYAGETYAEYTCWTVAIYVQQQIGATVDSCYAYDLSFRCAGTPLGLKTVKELMFADESIQTVLLCGGNANANIIDYEDPNQSFMYNMSPSAFAAIIKRDHPKNKILESAILTDPVFANDVVGKYGGSKNQLTATDILKIKENPSLLNRINKLSLEDPKGMKKRLAERSMPDFTTVVLKACEKCGVKSEQIDYFSAIATSPKAHFAIMDALKIEQNKTEYLYDYGHCGHPDNWIALDLGKKTGKLKAGDLVCMLGAGTGYAFSSTLIRWG